MRTCSVKFYDKFKASKNGVLIIGLPGVGLVGRLAAEYLVSNTKSERVASVFSDSFPPNIVSTPDSTVHVLRNDVFKLTIPKKKASKATASKTKGKKAEQSLDVYVLLGDAQPSLPPQGLFNAQHLFSADIAELAKELGCKQVCTIAGLPDQDRVKNGSKTLVLATQKALFSKIKGKYEKTGPGLPVNGAAGLVLQYALMQGLKGFCCIGTTSPQMVYPDFGAAGLIVNVLNKTYSLNLKEAALSKKLKTFEKKINDALKEQETVSMELPKGYDFPKDEPSMQGDERYPGYIR